MRAEVAVAPTMHGDIISSHHGYVSAPTKFAAKMPHPDIGARFVAIIDDTPDRERATDINFRDFVRCERVREYNVVEDVRKVHLDPPLRLFTCDVLSAGDDVHFV